MNPQCQAAPERNAFHEASILHSSFFGRPLTASSERQPASDHSKLSTRAQNERMCIGGHRGTIFGVSFSPDGRFLATASQDSTIRIWEVSSNKLVATLTEGLDVKFECLRVAWMDIGGLSSAEPHSSISDRYLLASAGADGVARLWSGFLTGADDDEGNLDWKCVCTLDHFVELKMDGGNSTSSEDPERPQIYALQFIHSNNMPNENLLLTAANDLVCFWTIEERLRPSDRQTEQNANKPTERQLIFHSSLQFARMSPSGETYINQFGGARNPDNEIYVFDSEFSEASNLVGAALSDGTCRIVSLGTTVDTTNDAINEKQCVLSLPPGYFPGARGGHLTALSWDKTGRRLATCIASGRVVLWTIAKEGNGGYLSLNPSCVAILNGGHDPGRPLFGAKYCGGTDERILLTWGTDGKLCAWDSCSSGENRTPMCTLVTHENYPIYTLDITNNTEATTQHIALGGGSDEGFLGVPTYIYDVSRE